MIEQQYYKQISINGAKVILIVLKKCKIFYCSFQLTDT